MNKSNYVLRPVMKISDKADGVFSGFGEIAAEIGKLCSKKEKTVVTIECYPGVDQLELLSGLEKLDFSLVINSDTLAYDAEKLDDCIRAELTNDAVFGVMTNKVLEDFFYEEKLAAARAEVASFIGGNVLIYGVGASLISHGDVLILADIARWEIQLRYRRGLENWRTAEKKTGREKYKRGFFAEWRWADREKKKCLPLLDFYLDMTTEGAPTMLPGESYRAALKALSERPFRMAPYFDPGVWGGDWMKEKFALPDNGSNYAWSFDGVPEENSILLGFGDKRVETPALNLVYLQTEKLLGARVRARFGAEFPIRFDMLDTIHGQNLSLQVHPLTEYIQEHFNMRYTQDESYYILDAIGEDTNVWLGTVENVDRSAMAADLYVAQEGGAPFPAEKYINKIPVKKHDHVLIPAGTLHCSGSNTMVLEISATPYIFTFKMWDWARVDLDGKPRPIHLEHGLKNVQWNRDTAWIHENLIGQEKVIHSDGSCTVERTGLHELEFIDTFRVSTATSATIKRNGSVHMLNLVEGAAARVISKNDSFAPFEVHYGETFILPEGAGEYLLAAMDNQPIKVLLACVRSGI